MIYAGILAAGFGVRMHRQDFPKPFLLLGDKPIIMHTLEQFYINSTVDSVIVVVAEEWVRYAADLIQKHDTMGKDVCVIAGGESKTHSVALAAKYITQNHGVTDGDILLAHDAIRPFVTQRIIDDSIRVAAEHGAASTVMTTNDTIVVSSDGVHVNDVPPHGEVYAEQTPQAFKLKDLNAILEKASKSGIRQQEEDDILRMFINLGGKMRMVRGEYSNYKIINPYDLEVANALLAVNLK